MTVQLMLVNAAAETFSGYRHGPGAYRAVLQGVHNNYEIDLFQKLLKAAAEIAGITDLTQSSLRLSRSYPFLRLSDSGWRDAVQ